MRQDQKPPASNGLHVRRLRNAIFQAPVPTPPPTVTVVLRLPAWLAAASMSVTLNGAVTAIGQPGMYLRTVVPGVARDTTRSMRRETARWLCQRTIGFRMRNGILPRRMT